MSPPAPNVPHQVWIDASDPVAHNGCETHPVQGELGLVAAILFHALNGVRVILIDFWPKGVKFQNAMFWVVIVIAVILFAGFAPRHLMHVFGGAN